MTKSIATEDIREIERLCKAVDEFAEEMKTILTEKACKGFHGWRNPKYRQGIVKKLWLQSAKLFNRSKSRRCPVHVANLAMMIWHLDK